MMEILVGGGSLLFFLVQATKTAMSQGLPQETLTLIELVDTGQGPCLHVKKKKKKAKKKITIL